jgi:hypothetical protein
MPGRNYDEVLILALATGANLAGAAQQAGVSERTARRRLSDPAFRARVKAQREDLVGQAVGRLSALGALAGDVLSELLASASEQVRLGAVRAALGYMFQGQTLETTQAEIAQLKEDIALLKREAKRRKAYGPGAFTG